MNLRPAKRVTSGPQCKDYLFKIRRAFSFLRCRPPRSLRWHFQRHFKRLVHIRDDCRRLLPAIVPIDTISFASATESSYFFINAPFPVLTSSTIASLPEANFLLIIELAIRDILSTVAVTSRRAYSFLSAGARLAVCPASAIPISRTFLKRFSPEAQS